MRGARAALCLWLSVLAVSPTAATGQPASLPDLEDEVMCPICGTVLEGSEAPQAERQRALIRRLIDEGRTKEEIKEALVAEYGPEVLATPESEGFDLAAWIVPALALLGGGVAIALRAGRGRANEAADPAGSTALSEDEQRRLEAEMRDFDS